MAKFEVHVRANRKHLWVSTCYLSPGNGSDGKADDLSPRASAIHAAFRALGIRAEVCIMRPGAKRVIYLWQALAVLLIALASGCSTGTRADFVLDNPGNWETVPAGHTLYTPDPELIEVFQSAADRIFDASGIRLEVAPDPKSAAMADHGIRITRGHVELEGEEACAAAFMVQDENGPRLGPVFISRDFERLNCGDDFESTLIHELLHHRRPYKYPLHTEGDRGLMAAHVNDVTWIDDVSLEWLCEEAPCEWFQPEGTLDGGFSND